MVFQQVSECLFKQISSLLLKRSIENTRLFFFSKPLTGLTFSMEQSLEFTSLSSKIVLFTSPKTCIPKAFLSLYFCLPVFFVSNPFFSSSLLCTVYPGSSVIAIWHQKILLVLSCKQSALLIIILDYSVQSFYFSDCVLYFCISLLQINEWYILVKYTRNR